MQPGRGRACELVRPRARVWVDTWAGRVALARVAWMQRLGGTVCARPVARRRNCLKCAMAARSCPCCCRRCPRLLCPSLNACIPYDAGLSRMAVAALHSDGNGRAANKQPVANKPTQRQRHQRLAHRRASTPAPSSVAAYFRRTHARSRGTGIRWIAPRPRPPHPQGIVLPRQASQRSSMPVQGC